MSDTAFIGNEFRIPIYRGGGRFDHIDAAELPHNWGVMDPPWPSYEDRFRVEFGREAQRHWFLPRSSHAEISGLRNIIGAQRASNAIMRAWFDWCYKGRFQARHGIDEDASPYWKTSVRRPWYAGIMDWWSSLWRK